ncbi:hypothetical protein [Rahnella inusitata]|nr:hypothetical protein [Rahnella inusitata]
MSTTNLAHQIGFASRKSVYVNRYQRIRYGRLEHVIDHFRSPPN